jgi:PAS domain S-box-containing protein/diguanylate cyclase (GGDEF)-like protein
VKLLIVDDRAMNLNVLRVQMESRGHSVVEAGNGAEALEVLERESVDGVIADVLMPVMDGYRFCLEVRRRPHLATLPIVVYSGTYISEADRKLALTAGADAFLRKPAPADAILEALRSASGRHPPASEPLPTELEAPVLRQYNAVLVRKLESKSAELEEANERLSQAEARLAGMLESALDAIVAIDQSHRVVLFNAAAERMFGTTREKVMGQRLDAFIPERFRATHDAQIDQFGRTPMQSRPVHSRQVWALHGDGHEFPIDASISQLETPQGHVYTVFVRDVTERLRAQSSLDRLNRGLSVLSGINSLIVRATDRDDLLRNACRIAVEAGWFLQAWIGVLPPDSDRLRVAAGWGTAGEGDARLQAWLAMAPPSTLAVLADAARGADSRIFGAGDATACELHGVFGADGGAVAALPLAMEDDARGVLVLHAGPGVGFDAEECKLLRELAGDISYALDHLQKTRQLDRMANLHPVSGLPNRRRFVDGIERVLREGADAVGPLAVVLLDLERFRHVNETHGRGGGDGLLRDVAARLQAAEPSAAHIGVDVFAIKLRDWRDVGEVARHLEEIARTSFGAPFVLGSDEVRIGCRFGVAVHPGDGADGETLLHNAEAALRRAKATTQSCVFYAPELNARAGAALALESRLRRAVERQEFVLHYQPKIAFSDRRVRGVEALIRWQDPERGLIPPNAFIPILEESGLIAEVGQWALGQAIADQRAWREAGLASPRVAVNVSPLQLHRADFADRVLGLLAANPEALLELEITESLIMDQVERNVGLLRTLREAGVDVAIDDFGTGYCSLAYIAKLPVNSLKIDRTFVTAMPESPEGMSLVTSIIALAHALGMQVVAEGVETEEQARLLKLLACEQAQGFLFSRPVTAEAIAAILRADVPLPMPAPVAAG